MTHGCRREIDDIEERRICRELELVGIAQGVQVTNFECESLQRVRRSGGEILDVQERYIVGELEEIGIDPSICSVGDSYNRATAESLFRLFKTEIITRMGPWKLVARLNGKR